MKFFFYILITIFSSNAFAVSSEPASDDSYVVVVDGHLHKNGKRLRQWGVNLESGAFKSYLEIDRLVKRLKVLGFNAVRLWPTQGTFYSVKNNQLLFNITSKGNGSHLDRFDYLVAKLSQAGFSIQMTMLHYLHVSEFTNIGSEFSRHIFANLDEKTARLLIGILPYISKEFKGFYREHIMNVLRRVNPYTGRKYSSESSVSTWELANESRFVSCLTTEACLRKLPISVIKLVSLAWKGSPYNPDRKSIPNGVDALPESDIKTQYKKFVIQRFIDYSEELENYSRNIDGVGSGISQQPFLYNTGPHSPFAMAQKAYSAGDLFSLGGYHSPISKKNSKDRLWLPISEGGREIPYLSYLKINNKPFIVYETSFFRPYPYRAEWGIVLAALALQQDWDGVFLYTYGQPWAIYADSGRDTGYGYKPLPIPMVGKNSVKRAYTVGFHHGGDPVTMASWSLASGIFLGASEGSNTKKILWDIPERNIYRGSGYPIKFMNSKSRLAREGAVSLNFTKGSPVCSPCISNSATANGPQENYVNWDSEKKLLTIGTKSGKALVGHLEGDLGEIFPGIQAKVLKPGFGLIGIVNMGNGAFRLYAIKNVENTGFQFNPDLVNFKSPVGAMNGVISRGKLPLEYQSLDVVFSIDKSFKSVRELDFGFDLLSLTTGEFLKEIKPNAQTFFMELER